MQCNSRKESTSEILGNFEKNIGHHIAVKDERTD